MNPELFTVVKMASRNYQVLDESGSPLTNPEGIPLRFLSVGAARAEIEASKTDAELDDQPTVPAEVPVVPVTESGPVEAMSRTNRVLAAKTENEALVAWRLAGSDPATAPTTPVLDWMAAAPAVSRKTRPTRVAGPSVELVGIVRDAFTANQFGVSRLYGVARAAGVKASKVTMTAAVDQVRSELGLAS